MCQFSFKTRLRVSLGLNKTCSTKFKTNAKKNVMSTLTIRLFLRKQLLLSGTLFAAKRSKIGIYIIMLRFLHNFSISNCIELKTYSCTKSLKGGNWDVSLFATELNPRVKSIVLRCTLAVAACKFFPLFF